MTASIHADTTSAFRTVFRDYEGPPFSVRLWDGWNWSSSTVAKPVCTILLNAPSTLASLVVHPNEVTLGEEFISGDLDVEGDLISAFEVAEHLFRLPRRFGRKLAENASEVFFGAAQFLRHGALHSRRRDKASIAYHYDLPVAFFEPWLGNSLVYSCGYFEGAEDSLDAAQEQKLDLICRKLRLQPDERFLDIGCGWGSLVLHAGRAFHARSEGITLSQSQADHGRRRIADAGLEDCCSIRMGDYRELGPALQSFDKIASVGMYEHVGLQNLSLYFGIVHRLLRAGGLFLNHGIARSEDAPASSISFVSRYVFPDGRLVTLPQAILAAESQGLEVRDVENLREHYEMTLRHWLCGLREHRQALLQLVPEMTYRIWLLYTAGSAAAFRRGDIAIYQVLFSRPDHAKSSLPLTRDGLYARRGPSGGA